MWRFKNGKIEYQQKENTEIQCKESITPKMLMDNYRETLIQRDKEITNLKDQLHRRNALIKKLREVAKRLHEIVDTKNDQIKEDNRFNCVENDVFYDKE